MGIYDNVETSVDFSKLEEEILKFWKEHEIFGKVRMLRKGGRKFVFLEGPPTANGLPHVGHVLTRCIKDVVLRFRTMIGDNVVPRIAGWDCHGLPVEIEVEKELRLNSKRDIEVFGVGRFNEMCRMSVFKYEREWVKMTERTGTWLDMEHPYVTLSKEYIESVWWSLKQLWEKTWEKDGEKGRLLYKDYYVVLYCPRCGTPLSSHEVALGGYKDTADPSIHVKFKVKGEENTYFLVWTTTPWTLLSNVALAVHPDLEYILVEQKGEKYILAKPLQMLLEGSYKVLKTFKGRELEGREYEPLYSYVKPDRKAWYVVLGDFVTETEGTGVVHIAPAFGPEDFEVAKKYKLPVIQLVDDTGHVKDEAEPFKGLYIKEADEKIIENLRSRGLLYKAGTVVHPYPHCWRCDTPLLYYAIDTWYIKMSALREKLLENNEKINWYPSYFKKGRFGKFIEEAKDWALSRNRFWGTPLPVWTCPNGHHVCIGSYEELEGYAGKLPENFDPHKPWVDEISFPCPECGGTMKREPYVIDCWYDSGAAPFAQYHYPFENVGLFKETFPVTFITEAVDQCRGWFYTLHAVATAVFGSYAYENVLSLGHVLDEQGRKMSKSRGNVVDPNVIFTNVGADAMRWYFFVSSPPWIPKRFSEKMVVETRNRFLNTLWNVYFFYVTNANIDEFNPHVGEKPRVASGLDRWLLSRLSTLTKTVRKEMENYMIHRAARALDEFVVDELSNWYLRRSRRRFWRNEMDEDKRSAYHTLYRALETLTRLLAPFIPFTTEAMYRNLSREDEKAAESVHMTDFPEPVEEEIDLDLERDMELVIKLAASGRSARASKGIKLRHPLREAVVVAQEEVLRNIAPLEEYLKDELNVKEVNYSTKPLEYLTYAVKPNFKSLGPKLKGEIKKVVEQLSKEKPEDVAVSLEEKGEYVLRVEGGTFTLTREDVEVEVKAKEGYAVGEPVIYVKDGRRSAVYLLVNTEVTGELRREALAREVVRRIQAMRKDMNLDFMQRINVAVKCDPAVFRELNENMEYIKNETLAETITHGEGEGYSKEWVIDGVKVTITIKAK